MANPVSENTSDPLRGVLSIWFTRAKTWWAVSLGAQVIASLAGAVSVLTNRASSEVALA
jgi:hypothetical protein